MGFFSSKKTPVTTRQNQTTQNNVWGGAQPALTSSLNAMDRYTGGYQGPYSVDPNAWQREAEAGIVNRARQGTPLAPAAGSAVMSGLGFSNPFQPAAMRYGNISAGAGTEGLLGLAATGGQPDPFLQPLLEANTAAQAQAFAPALGRFGASLSGARGDVGLRGMGGIGQEAGGQYIQDMMRGFGQANTAALSQSARDQANRQQDAIARLYGGGQSYLQGGAGTAAQAEGLRQGAVGIAPTAYNLGFADLNQIMNMGDRGYARDEAALGRQMDQYNRDAAYAQNAARTAAGVGGQFGDTTTNRMNTKDVYSKPMAMQLLGPALSLGGSFLGGPGGAAVGQGISNWFGGPGAPEYS